MESSKILPLSEYEGMKNKAFLERLDSLLDSKEWTRYRLAQEWSGDFSGVGKPPKYGTISSWYKGNGQFPGTEQLMEIANIFNVSVDYLLGRHDMVDINSEYIYRMVGLDTESQKAIIMLNSLQRDDNRNFKPIIELNKLIHHHKFLEIFINMSDYSLEMDWYNKIRNNEIEYLNARGQFYKQQKLLDSYQKLVAYKNIALGDISDIIFKNIE